MSDHVAPGTVWALAMGALVAFIYILPIIIARGPDRRRIVWFAVLLGWTVIGWFIALRWAIRSAETEIRSQD